MRSNNSGRALRVRAAVGAGLAALVLAGIAASASATGSTAPTGPVSGVTVRVEGLTKTLLAPTTVTLQSGSVSKGGVAADSCDALSGLGALQDATNGNWAGTWSSSYKSYFITSILGTSYPETADYYWAFWLDNKPAASGACGVDPVKGSSVLFFPEYDGKNKSIVAPAVLGISAPASVLVGKPFAVVVSSYANSNGKRKPAAGARVGTSTATVSTQQHSSGELTWEKTNAKGDVTLSLSKPGNTTIAVSAPNSIRDETTICVHKPGASCPKP
jgi:hypothetical protein